MNQWIADIFGRLLTVLHVIVFIGLALFWSSSLDNYDTTTPTLITLGLLILYVLFVGIIATFISIHETLQRIEKLQRRESNSSAPDLPTALTKKRN